MRTATALLICVMAISRTAAQQHPMTRMGGLVLSGFAGGAAYSDLQRSAARAESMQAPISVTEFTRRLSPKTSGAFAVAIGYWFSEKWGLRAHTGVAPTRFEVAVSEREAAAIPTDTTLTPRSPFAGLTIWTYDATALYRIPITPRGRVAPYALLGGGVLRYSAGEKAPTPPEAEAVFSQEKPVTKAAAVFGVGAIVPLQRRNLALTFELTDHLSHTPVERSAVGTLAQGQNLRIVTSDTNDPGGEGRVKITNNVRLLIGVSWLVR